MESAGRSIENEQERKVMQDIGIGTPATRASIIETLFTRSYIQRDKKSLIPTEKGLQVYELVKNQKIADVTMTAQWELALQKIETGQADSAEFQKEMESYASVITAELLRTNINKSTGPDLMCPKCKSHSLIIRDKIVKCPDENCNWTQFRNICEKLISTADIESLVSKGKTSLIKGMKSRAGKNFDAYIILQEDCTTTFEFPTTKNSKRNGK